MRTCAKSGSPSRASWRSWTSSAGARMSQKSWLLKDKILRRLLLELITPHYRRPPALLTLQQVAWNFLTTQHTPAP